MKPTEFLSQIVSLYLPNDILCKKWRNTNDELVPGSFIFVPGFRDKKYQSKTKRGQMARFLKKYLSKTIWLKNHAKEAKSRNKQPNFIHRLTNNTVARLSGK
jgi:hypothetical protein